LGSGWIALVLAACVVSGLSAHLLARGHGSMASGCPSAPPPPARAPSQPTLDRFVFGITPALPRSNPELLPAEATTVFGFAPWPAGARREEVQARWSWRGGAFQDAPVTPVRSPDGTLFARVALQQRPPAPLGPGVGEVELRLRGQRAAHGCFVLAAQAARVLAQQAPPSAQTRVSGLAVGGAVGADGRVVRPQAKFQPLDRIWVSFAYSGADPGASFVVYWYAGDNELRRARKTLTVGAPAGIANAWLQAHGKGLPPGPYRVSVCYGADPVPLAQADFQVQAASGNAPAAANPARKATPPSAAAPPRSKN
jgi:hypothetical protein